MNRVEAMTYLKELSASQIIDPTWVSLERNSEVFQLKIKASERNPELEAYCTRNDLTLTKDNGYWLISKP